MRNQVLTPLFEKKRELETLITTLKSQCEIDERKSRETAEALTDLNTRLENLNKLIEAIEQIGEEAVVSVSGVITESLEAVKGAVGLVDKTYELLRQLGAKVAESELKLENTKKEQAERLDEINRENGKLAILKKDLDIYRDRLEKKAYELGFGELILPK